MVALRFSTVQRTEWQCEGATHSENASHLAVSCGLAQNESIFNEAIEKKWVEHWLFFANSTRFSSAMAGADYGVFANGRWYMNKNIQEMIDWLELKGREKK